MSATKNNSIAFRPVLAYKAPENNNTTQSKEQSEQNVTQLEAIRELQKDVQVDPLVSAVFHAMALRERNRHNLTTRGLYYKMRKEGFQYQEKDYIPVLNKIASLGLAKPVLGKRGRLEALSSFKMPIRDLGAAACGQNVEHKRTTIVRVPHVEAAPMKSKASEHPILIVLYINGKPVEMKLPSTITKEELLTLITRFQDRTALK